METLGKNQIIQDKQNKYNEQFLNKRHTALFVTIPQTTIKTQELVDNIQKYKQVSYLLAKREQHKDNGEHIHLVIKFKQQVKTKSIHSIIMKTEGKIDGLIDYKKPEHIGKCISYLFKEETSIEEPIEYGERPIPQGRPSADKETEYHTAIELAENGQLEEAMETIKSADPLEYIKYKETFKENLKTENKVRKYYTLPDYSKAKLSRTQQQVWDILQEAPKPRRIIWVSGEYGAGKSFLYQYIKSNHEYEMYDAGQSASLDNVAYGYDQEGVIAWDLPRTFDWEEKGDHIANVIEKFSDFGQSITSKKYKGKTQQVRGHTIVFSNSPPIDQLAHRDIIHVRLKKEIPPMKSERMNEVNDAETVSEEIASKRGEADNDANQVIEQEEYPETETDEEFTEDQILTTPTVGSIELRGNQYRVKHFSNGKNRISYVKTLEEAEALTNID